MYLASVLIGSAALLWSGYLFTRESDRRLLIAAGLPALLVVFDGWAWISSIDFSGIGQVLWIGTHFYVLGMVIWISTFVRQHAEMHDRHSAELVQARYESEAMRRLKTAFLANINHEIRTPLTSIIGFSSLLSGEVAVEHRNMMRVIERSGQRLLDTLDSFLDLAMLEAGRVQLNHEMVDLSEEARFHASRFGPLARSKGLSLDVHAPPSPVTAIVDRSCLSRIFARLIANALKFTEEGSVTIDVRASNGRCRVAIVDTGIGIDEEYLPYLFNEFTQASSGTGRAFEGSGLGLAVTKRLVDLLDGSIDVETQQFEGSTFVITLPSTAPSGDGAPSRTELLPQIHER